MDWAAAVRELIEEAVIFTLSIGAMLWVLWEVVQIWG